MKFLYYLFYPVYLIGATQATVILAPLTTVPVGLYLTLYGVHPLFAALISFLPIVVYLIFVKYKLE